MTICIFSIADCFINAILAVSMFVIKQPFSPLWALLSDSSVRFLFGSLFVLLHAVLVVGPDVAQHACEGSVLIEPAVECYNVSHL